MQVTRKRFLGRVTELTEQLREAREGGEGGEGGLWRALREAEGRYWSACVHLRSVREESAAGDVGESLLALEECSFECEKAEDALVAGGWEGVWAGGGCQGQVRLFFPFPSSSVGLFVRVLAWRIRPSSQALDPKCSTLALAHSIRNHKP